MYKFSHGVYHNSQIAYIDEGAGKNDTVDPARSWSDLAELALARGLKTLWILPGAGEFRVEENHGAWSFDPYQRDETKEVFMVSVIKRGIGKNIALIFIEGTSWDEVWHDIDAKDLAMVLRYIEHLGIPVKSSAGSTGWAYLKKIHPEWVETIPVNLHDLHFTPAAAKEIIWRREIRPDELQKKYLIKYDGNSAYPYAVTITDIGVGTPQHVPHGRDMDEFPSKTGKMRQSQAVGVWNCLVQGTPKNPELPTPWNLEDMPGKRWLSGPMINLIRAMGYTVKIKEGYVFPEHHDVMAKWANDLWGYRNELKDKKKRCANLAAKAVKHIANTTVGFTAFGGFSDEQAEKRRPDIRLQAVSQSIMTVWFNIRKIYEETGELPVIVYMDAMYYLSDDPAGGLPRAHFAKRETKLGGFKLEWCVEMTPEVRQVLTQQKKPAVILEGLNKIVGKE